MFRESAIKKGETLAKLAIRQCGHRIVGLPIRAEEIARHHMINICRCPNSPNGKRDLLTTGYVDCDHSIIFIYHEVEGGTLNFDIARGIGEILLYRQHINRKRYDESGHVEKVPLKKYPLDSELSEHDKIVTAFASYLLVPRKILKDYRHYYDEGRKHDLVEMFNVPDIVLRQRLIRDHGVRGGW